MRQACCNMHARPIKQRDVARGVVSKLPPWRRFDVVMGLRLACANKQRDVARGDVSTTLLQTHFVTGLTSSWGTQLQQRCLLLVCQETMQSVHFSRSMVAHWQYRTSCVMLFVCCRVTTSHVKSVVQIETQLKWLLMSVCPFPLLPVHLPKTWVETFMYACVHLCWSLHQGNDLIAALCCSVWSWSLSTTAEGIAQWKHNLHHTQCTGHF